MRNNSDWKLTVKQMLVPIQFEENPFGQIENVIKSFTETTDKLTQAVGDLEIALKHSEGLSFLIQQPHSEEVVRDYLYDVLNGLKAVAPPPAPTAKKTTGTKFKPKARMIIAVDFDGTIVEHKFPDIGDPLPGAIETLRDLQNAGHRLILFTCREDEMDSTGRKYLTEAVDFCKRHGINFVSANQTLTEDDFRPMGGRKVYADVYIDDRNIGGFVGWEKIRETLFG